jgi:hypothetical protein
MTTGTRTRGALGMNPLSPASDQGLLQCLGRKEEGLSPFSYLSPILWSLYPKHWWGCFCPCVCCCRAWLA